MSLVFINHTQETFTPTQSGALATIIWECCRVAERSGVNPAVITRTCREASFAWSDIYFVDYPHLSNDRLATLMFRADRKLTGWRHSRQREYASRVVRTIASARLCHSSLVLMNDPEMAVVLRDAFPRARIIHWFQNQHECKPRYRRLFAGAVDAVAGCSDFISRWAEHYYCLAPGAVRTIYNGVDPDTFSPARREPDGPLVVNFVGRTGIEKGPDVLLKAALLLARKTTRFALQLIGSNHWDRFEMDAYQQQLSELTRELESAGVSVRRPGHIGRRDVPDELREAHIHVVPARWDEPFGMTTIEGMSCGLATIASRTGGTPEILEGHGLLFERDCAEELAASIESFLCDPTLRRHYAERARKRASEFSWNRAWAALTEVALPI